ncbi:MAG: hypothetical protein E7559_00630 [Ruminococcaceae bacterium]|nr:hypothetical protein [Oscillospiraceae bacterium]
MKNWVRRVLSAVLAMVLLLAVLPATGCVKDDWEGTWNRTGDSTFSRAILRIRDVNNKGFTFSMTLYNGNIAGRLTQLRAAFIDRAGKVAEYEVPDSRATITFTLNEKGDMDVLFYDEAVSFTETEDNPYSSSSSMETTVFGFDALVFITGQFTRGEVEYINGNLYEAGVLNEEQSAALQEMMPDEVHTRLLDCFQLWEVVPPKPDLNNDHDDEIGGYVYHGSNTMQKYAAIVIAFDDGSVCAAVSKTDGSIVYYSNNHIYTDGQLTPLPVNKWIQLYNAEINK